MTQKQKIILKHKICIAGPAVTEGCQECTFDDVKILGQEIAKKNNVLLTGATDGVPYWAAAGAKEAGGFTIGFSPANSLKEHLKTYKLPVDYLDMIVYTGFDYSGRNLLLSRSADAVIIVCGRMGTLNEFTIAFEDQKPIGILNNTGGMTNLIKNIVKKANKPHDKIIYSDDPKKLLKQLITLIENEKQINPDIRLEK